MQLAVKQGTPIVKTAIKNINVSACENLLMSMNDNNPYYTKLRLYLKELKEITGCKYLYTMSRMPDGKYRYIVDGGDPGSDVRPSATLIPSFR